MKLDSIGHFVSTLHQLHQEIERDPNNQTITDKISQTLDDNSDYLEGNIEIAIELDSIAAVIKTNARDNPVIQKIRRCVQQILPDAEENRKHSLDLLRNKGNLRQIADWITLNDIPVDKLPLTIEELYEVLKIMVDDTSVSSEVHPMALASATLKLLKLNKKLNDNEHKIVISLAKYCAQNNAEYTVGWIKYFGITDQAALVEIAKLCAQQNVQKTVMSFNNFGIEDQKGRLELAQLCAKLNCRVTVEHIERLRIQNQANLVEIAKICANQNGRATAEYIHKFGIQDQDTLVEIAKICAKDNGIGPAQHIKNFGIKEEKELVEIAMLYAVANTEETARNIKKFGIKEEKALVELAKLCANQNGRATAEYIQNFGIQDKEGLVEIAMICAKSNAGETAKKFMNFGIKEEKALVELATICAIGNAEETAKNIGKFGIEDEDDLVEIAKLCAKGNGGATARYLKNFFIQKKATLLEIAKLCAKFDGGNTAQYIQSLKIEDKDELVEIAKLCAKSDGEKTAEYIQKFGIEDQQDRLNIFWECIKQSEKALRFANNFAPLPEAFHEVFEAIQSLKNNDGTDQLRSKLIKTSHQVIQRLELEDECKGQLEELCDKIFSADPYQQHSQALWFLCCLVLMILLDQNARNWIIRMGLLKELSALRNPQLRQQLTGGLFALAESEEGRDRWSQFVSNLTSEKGGKLLSIPLFGLEKKNVLSKEIHQALDKVLKPRIMKDARKIQLILHVTDLLVSTPVLKDEQRGLGFHKIFLNASNVTQILENAKAAKGLLQLKEEDWTESTKELKELFSGCFEKMIPLEGFEGDLTQMYDKFFANSRHPDGLITYAAGLKTLGEPELLKCLGRYVVSVFDGTFKSIRYDQQNNPHLAKIYEARPDLKEKWGHCSELQFQNVSKFGSLQEEMFDAKDWLQTRLCQFGHLGKEDVSFIQDYLEAESDESRKAVKKSLTDALLQWSKRKNEVELDQDLNVPNLKIQLACINLAMKGNKIPLAELEEPLMAILRNLNANGIQEEFVNDVRTMLGAITKPGRLAPEALQVVITDDPIDLLFVGIDVDGSCQRLDGSPNTNKGLLGYLMDGKHQILAIKDRSGKMVARAILRLMWDGEKPVLFRETFYSDASFMTRMDTLMYTMNDAAMQLAKTLEVAITASEGRVPYGKALHSLGGPAPWEYCDASGGLRSRGAYSLLQANILEA